MLIQSILESAYVLAANNRPLAATDVIVDALDTLLLRRDYAGVRELLDSLDGTRLPPETLVTLLPLAWHGKSYLGLSWARFFDYALNTLASVWGYSEERLTRLRTRIQEDS